jgi:hypothetical protein
MPHLLRHGASVYTVSSDGPSPTSHGGIWTGDAKIRTYIKNVVFLLTWKKNRVGGLEFLNFFFNFISNSSEYIANSNTIMRIFIELNKSCISCIHRASVHMQNCPVANTKMCSIFLEQIRFFLRGSIKFLGLGLKFRVGRVSGNTFFFFWYGLTRSLRLCSNHCATWAA